MKNKNPETGGPFSFALILDSGFSPANHRVHFHVVRLGERVGDDLKRETNADFESIGTGLGKQAVIESATTTEAVSVVIEGKAGADEGVDFVERDFH